MVRPTEPWAEAHTDGHGHGEDCKVSDKYTQFIVQHLELLKEQCVHFTACITKLLQTENPVHVLTGEDIRLNKTCGLVYRNGTGEYNTLDGLCSQDERTYIRADIERHLKDKFLQGWRRVEDCLENNYGDKERTNPVDEICGLANKDEMICGRYKTHKEVESFFNEQIVHLKCTCQNLNKSEDDHHSHVPMYAAAAAGAGVVLLILLIIGFICYRRRRSRKSKKRGPNVIYLPAPNADNNPVYQEVYDVRNPPSLPMRYQTHPSRGLEEESAYLEPMEPGSMYRPKLPPMRGAPVNNPGYGAPPPKYSERPEDVSGNADEDDGYFQPLPPPPGEEQNPLKKAEETSGYETIEALGFAPPTPQGSNRSNVTNQGSNRSNVTNQGSNRSNTSTTAPIPAKRTKIEDPKQPSESPYFVLEREESTV